MELFLMVLVVSLLCLALTMLTFSAAMKDASSRAADASRVEAPAPAPSRFFGEQPAPAPVALNARMLETATEALLLQLERHIRLEHAAAQAFLEEPTAESLHSRTTSPLMN